MPGQVRAWGLHPSLGSRRPAPAGELKARRMGCVRRCARFHIGRGQLHERREHRGGRRGGGKIGHVAQAVRFTLGGWRVIDRRKRDEAFAGGELDWLASRQRRRGIAARVRRRRGLRFRFGQQPLIVPRRIGLALAGSGVRATRQNRQLGAGAAPVFASDPGAGSSAFVVDEVEAEGGARIGLGNLRLRRRGCLGRGGGNLGRRIVFPLARLEDHHRDQDRRREP